MKLSNQLYDVLKFVAQYVLPSSAALYFALSGIWGFPYANEVSGTIMAVDVFLGALLQISINNYREELAVVNRMEAYTNPECYENAAVTGVEDSPVKTWLTQAQYDIVYWVSLVLLPAMATLYFALSSLWAFPYGKEVVATVAAVDTFLAVILGVSNYQYKQSLQK